MDSESASRARLIERFREMVTESSAAPAFVHHQWYVKYHLQIVERIALELTERHPTADRDLVTVLVWLHDYGKTLDRDRQYETTLSAGRAALADLGFDSEFVDRAVSCAELIDSSAEVDLRTAPLEVQIVSSADGCSHLVGPFFYLWWSENADRPFEQLMADNRRKLHKDWTRKIVLPEARAAFATRYRVVMEQVGDLPERYLS